MDLLSRRLGLAMMKPLVMLVSPLTSWSGDRETSGDWAWLNRKSVLRPKAGNLVLWRLRRSDILTVSCQPPWQK